MTRVHDKEKEKHASKSQCGTTVRRQVLQTLDGGLGRSFARKAATHTSTAATEVLSV